MSILRILKLLNGKKDDFDIKKLNEIANNIRVQFEERKKLNPVGFKQNNIKKYFLET